MKLTITLLLALAIQGWAVKSYSQKTGLNLNMKNAGIVDILEEIENQSDFYFLFNYEQVSSDKKTDIQFSDKKIEEILDSILKGTDLKYSISGRQIVISQDETKQSGYFYPLIFQQQKTIRGSVTNTGNEPIPGVTVIVKGTNNGIITDVDGTYTISNVADDAILVFSFVGMKTQEVIVSGKQQINIALEEETIGLEEIVTIGYGVQKKTTITGSISTIQGEELAEVPVPNISQSIAGRLAGVSMRPNGGQPGYDDPDIHIRGIVTTGDNKPLVVVDGVKRDNIRQIDPNTIESITILKDAAAVAPYGMGGANGVILITTKKGKTGKPVVRMSASYGIQNLTYTPDMLNAKDYMALQNEGYYNLTPNGTTPPNDPELIANYDRLHKEDPYRYPDSDFTDFFKDDEPTQNYNVEISGGTDLVKYTMGGGFYDQQGIFDKVSYHRYNYNMGLEMQATPTTKVSMTLNGSVERTNDLDAAEETSGHLFRAFYKFIPTQTLLYPDGEHWGESSASSPVAALRSEGYEKTDRNTLLASFAIEQELPFIKGLSVKGVFSYDPTHTDIKSWHIPFVYHKINLNTDPYTFEEAITTQEAYSEPYTWLALENQRSTNYTYQGYINYNRTFGDHSVSGLFVAEARKTKYKWFNAQRNNFDIRIDELNMGSSDKNDYDNGGSSSTGSEIGYVYRFGYTYQDKYIFEASGRFDGHYYFAPGEQWGYFPAFSAAWRISEEKFMKKYSIIDNLKLRASWGKSGMLAGSAFQYQSGYELRGNAYAFGNSRLVQGSEVTREANPDITWEISYKYDIGFDLNMWDGLLNFEFDYFHEKREDMLLAPQVTLPVEYGLELSQENKGEMKGHGIEFVVGSRKVLRNGMDLAITANFSYAKNEMIEVFESDAKRNNPNRTSVGRPYGTPFGYKSMGLFSTADDLNGDGKINSDDGYTVQQFGELHPGDIRYADLSGPDGVPDGKIDANDETVIGDPVYPRITYGFTPSVKWKGFDLFLFFQGAAKASIDTYQFMTVPFENNGSNTGYEYFNNRWTVDNQHAKYPRATTAPASNNNQDSDFWYKSTSYIRLKTATLGYTLPKRITDRLQIGDIRFYVVAQNLFTHSNHIKHVDPEMGYDDRETAYPLMKSTTFGIDITF